MAARDAIGLVVAPRRPSATPGLNISAEVGLQAALLVGIGNLPRQLFDIPR